MNILKRLFDKICLFFVISLIFISCSDFSSGKEWTNISSKGRISISTNLSNAESRTVLPNGSFFTEASGYKWELSAQKSGETSSKVVGTWEDVINSTTGTITTAYKNMTEGSFDVLIDVGTYNFNLVATKDGKRVLEGSIINGNIVSGECNRLNFTMKEASGTDIANGSINFKLILKNIGVVSNIKANLSKLDGSAVVSDGNLTPIPADDKSCEYVVFKKDSIFAGNYMLKLELQQNDVEETIGVYTCIIRVAPGLCSQGEYILEELAQLYTITYELNNGNFNESLVDNCYPYNKYTSVVLPTPTREGYAFGGWYNNVNLTGEKITQIANGSAENITLFAKWNANTYTVKFDSNGGSGEMGSQTFTYDAEQALTANTFTRTGYTFAGWATTANGETEYTDGETVSNLTAKDKATVILYAVWEIENYTITYNLDDGGINAESNPASYTVETDTITLVDATKTGYVFLGWYTDGACTEENKITKIEKGSTVNITLYAKWCPVNFVYVQGATITGAITAEGSEIFIADKTVTVPNLYVCDHEVTQAEYGLYCSYGGSYPNETEGLGDNYPAYYINWYDALVYCNKRSIAEGLTPCYTIKGSTAPNYWGPVPTASNSDWDEVTCNSEANGYRLPTEAEWEYVARGGNGLTGYQYEYAGSDTIDDVAWYKDNSNGKAHEVKGKEPNGLGIYDMSGNVWEWCWDSDSDSSGNRYKRGGSWGNEADMFAVSFRNIYLACNRISHYGFRVVRTAE